MEKYIIKYNTLKIPLIQQIVINLNNQVGEDRFGILFRDYQATSASFSGLYKAVGVNDFNKLYIMFSGRT